MFERPKEREGAYDFLESEHVDAEAVAESVFDATAKRIAGQPYAYVVIDGSSLSLSRRDGSRDFGPVGTRWQQATGLIVNTALAVAGDGTPLGIIDQSYWSRGDTLDLTPVEVTARNALRKFEEKEPAEIVRSATRSIERLAAVGAHAWIVIDRVADNRDILQALSATSCVFTVRATYNRQLSKHGRLHAELAEEPLLGEYEVDVGRTSNRPARRAVMEMRAKRVELLFRDRPSRHTERLEITAVWLREKSNEKNALDWIIYTNAPVTSVEQGLRIVEAYRTRWRIEEFHRTWKQGHCNVEEGQLHSKEAVVIWSTILAATAARIERLKYSSRRTPDVPAITVLREVEVEVLQLHRREDESPAQRRRKRVPVDAVSLRDATEWIAELGGWNGRSHGPPGSTRLARGLEKLAATVYGFELAMARLKK